MSRRFGLLIIALVASGAACPRHRTSTITTTIVTTTTIAPPVDAGVDAALAIPPPDASVPDAFADAPILVDAPVAVVQPEEWLKGSTHVHAKPSGDSETPIPDVIHWYETHGYDFIVLTDHNKVSEVDAATSTAGQPAVFVPPPGQPGLIVLAGIELTHNPDGCQPQTDPSNHCRIHANLLGVSERPVGKLDWANRKSSSRLDKYQAVLDQQRALGGIAQLNHPNWFWGMTSDLLVELAHRGFLLVEVANAAFSTWQQGDATHPSAEALWDAALVRGAHLWGVSSDDAHVYATPGKYPAGGGFIVVHARREPHAILRAIFEGHFYASTGVMLARLEVTTDELHIDVVGPSRGTRIAWIENGRTVETVAGTSAHRTLPTTGYLRATITRRLADGTVQQAWVQPQVLPN